MEMNIDYIKTVKVQELNGEITGYLINGELSVPKAEGNRHYKDVKEWLESNTPEPMFTAEELAEQAKQKAIAEAKAYLNDSDWVVTKIAEAGVTNGDVEALKTKYADVLSHRELMRETINLNEAS